MLLCWIARLLLVAICVGEAEEGWFITVEGRLRAETLAALHVLPEVASVENGIHISIIMLSVQSTAAEQLLTQGHYAYAVERNDAVQLDRVAPPWNLQRLMQTEPVPLSGRYTPPGRGSGISVFIFDTGILLEQQEFGGRAHRVEAWKNELPCLGETHGTWVASIVGGSTLGVAQNATLWDMKLPNGQSCSFFVCDAVMALSWLLHNLPEPPFLCVMSWKTSNSPSLIQLCGLLRAQGAVLFVAAGNTGSATDPCQLSPSNAGPATLSVGAVDDQDTRASWSNYGPCVDIYAAGVSIVGAGTASTTALVVGDGTSAAAPGAAGVAAVLCEVYGLTTPDEIEAKLFEHSLKNTITGSGTTPNFLVSFAPTTVAAAASSTTTPPPPPSPAVAPAVRLACVCLYFAY